MNKQGHLGTVWRASLSLSSTSAVPSVNRIPGDSEQSPLIPSTPSRPPDQKDLTFSHAELGQNLQFILEKPPPTPGPEPRVMLSTIFD